jgi:hypothetical protein
VSAAADRALLACGVTVAEALCVADMLDATSVTSNLPECCRSQIALGY